MSAITGGEFKPDDPVKRMDEFVRFAGESHGMSGSGRPANRLERLHRMMQWWGRHSGG